VSGHGAFAAPLPFVEYPGVQDCAYPVCCAQNSNDALSIFDVTFNLYVAPELIEAPFDSGDPAVEGEYSERDAEFWTLDATVSVTGTNCDWLVWLEFSTVRFEEYVPAASELAPDMETEICSVPPFAETWPLAGFAETVAPPKLPESAVHESGALPLFVIVIVCEPGFVPCVTE